MSSKFEFTKAEYVNAIKILLDFPKGQGDDLSKLSQDTLALMYEGQIKNARAYQNLKANRV